MPPIPDGPLEDGKTENDLESAKFTKVYYNKNLKMN